MASEFTKFTFKPLEEVEEEVIEVEGEQPQSLFKFVPLEDTEEEKKEVDITVTTDVDDTQLDPDVETDVEIDDELSSLNKILEGDKEKKKKKKDKDKDKKLNKKKLNKELNNLEKGDYLDLDFTPPTDTKESIIDLEGYDLDEDVKTELKEILERSDDDVHSLFDVAESHGWDIVGIVPSVVEEEGEVSVSRVASGETDPATGKPYFVEGERQEVTIEGGYDFIFARKESEKEEEGEESVLAEGVSEFYTGIEGDRRHVRIPYNIKTGERLAGETVEDISKEQIAYEFEQKYFENPDWDKIPPTEEELSDMGFTMEDWKDHYNRKIEYTSTSKKHKDYSDAFKENIRLSIISASSQFNDDMYIAGETYMEYDDEGDPVLGSFDVGTSFYPAVDNFNIEEQRKKFPNPDDFDEAFNTSPYSGFGFISDYGKIFANVEMGEFGPILKDVTGFGDDKFVKKGTWEKGKGNVSKYDVLGVGAALSMLGVIDYEGYDPDKGEPAPYINIEDASNEEVKAFLKNNVEKVDGKPFFNELGTTVTVAQQDAHITDLMESMNPYTNQINELNGKINSATQVLQVKNRANVGIKGPLDQMKNLNALTYTKDRSELESDAEVVDNLPEGKQKERKIKRILKRNDKLEEDRLKYLSSANDYSNTKLSEYKQGKLTVAEILSGGGELKTRSYIDKKSGFEVDYFPLTTPGGIDIKLPYQQKVAGSKATKVEAVDANWMYKTAKQLLDAKAEDTLENLDAIINLTEQKESLWKAVKSKGFLIDEVIMARAQKAETISKLKEQFSGESHRDKETIAKLGLRDREIYWTELGPVMMNTLGEKTTGIMAGFGTLMLRAMQYGGGAVHSGSRELGGFLSSITGGAIGWDKGLGGENVFYTKKELKEIDGIIDRVMQEGKNVTNFIKVDVNEERSANFNKSIQGQVLKTTLEMGVDIMLMKPGSGLTKGALKQLVKEGGGTWSNAKQILKLAVGVNPGQFYKMYHDAEWAFANDERFQDKYVDGKLVQKAPSRDAKILYSLATSYIVSKLDKIGIEATLGAGSTTIVNAVLGKSMKEAADAGVKDISIFVNRNIRELIGRRILSIPVGGFGEVGTEELQEVFEWGSQDVFNYLHDYSGDPVGSGFQNPDWGSAEMYKQMKEIAIVSFFASGIHGTKAATLETVKGVKGYKEYGELLKLTDDQFELATSAYSDPNGMTDLRNYYQNLVANPDNEMTQAQANIEIKAHEEINELFQKMNLPYNLSTRAKKAALDKMLKIKRLKEQIYKTDEKGELTNTLKVDPNLAETTLTEISLLEADLKNIDKQVLESGTLTPSIDEDRESAKYYKKLEDDVLSGKITQEQADELEAEHNKAIVKDEFLSEASTTFDKDTEETLSAIASVDGMATNEILDLYADQLSENIANGDITEQEAEDRLVEFGASKVNIVVAENSDQADEMASLLEDEDGNTGKYKMISGGRRVHALITNQKDILIDKEASIMLGGKEAQKHEAFHWFLWKTIKNAKDEGNESVIYGMANAALEQLQEINLEKLKDNALISRIQAYESDEEISDIDTAEEVLVLLSDAMRAKTIKANNRGIKNLGNKIKNIFKTQGVDVEIEGGQGVINLIEDFNKSIGRGKFTSKQRQIIEKGAKVSPKIKKSKEELSKTKKKVGIKVAKGDITKKSKGKFSKAEILPVDISGMAQDIDKFIKDREFKTNEEFRTDQRAAGWFMELETNKQFQNYLKNLISTGIDLSGMEATAKREAEQEALIKLKERIQDRVLKNFNPLLEGKERSLFSYIYGSKAGKGKGGIAQISLLDIKKAYATTVRGVSKDQPTTEGKTFDIAAEGPTIEEQVDRAIIEKGKSKLTSKLRRKIKAKGKEGIQADLISRLKQTVTAAFAPGKLPSIESKEYKKALVNAFKTELKKDITDMMGKGKAYTQFLKDNRELLLSDPKEGGLPISYLVQIERLIPEDQRIFTKVVKRNLSPTEVIKYKDQDRVYTESETTGPTLYDRLSVKEKPFVKFFEPPSTVTSKKDPSKMVKSGLKGTRKDELGRNIGVVLALDLTPTIARRTMTTREQAELSLKTRKPLTLKFSKSTESRIKDQLQFEGDIRELKNVVTKIALKNEEVDIESLIQQEVVKLNKKRGIAYEAVVINKALEAIKKYNIKGLNVVNKKPTEKGGAADFTSTIWGSDFNVEVKLDKAQYSSVTLVYNFKKKKGKIKKEYSFNDQLLEMVTKAESALEAYRKRAEELGADLTATNSKIPIEIYNQLQEEGLQKAITTSIEVDQSIITELYANKKPPINYIQIKDKGLFWMGSNPLKLPIPELKSNVKVTMRVTRTRDAQGNAIPGIRFLPDQLINFKEVSDFSLDNASSIKKLMNSAEVDLLKVEQPARIGNIKQAQGSGVVKFSKSIPNSEVLREMGIMDKALNIARDINAPIKKIRVFDFDDTLAQTKSKVFYTMPDGKEGSLTAEAFAQKGTEMLEEGAEFDFSDFDKVVKGKKGPLFEVAQTIADKRGTEDLFVLTARGPNSAIAIKEFLDGIGLSIPLENITGLGDSSPLAKSGWIVDKAAEGYNDFYFADDHLKNVEAVQRALDALPIKGKTQQAKVKFSMDTKRDLKWEQWRDLLRSEFEVGGRTYTISLNNKAPIPSDKGKKWLSGDKVYELSFGLKVANPYAKDPSSYISKMGVENTGNAAEVLSIVSNGVFDFIKKNKVDAIGFNSGESSRTRLYDRLTKLWADKLGWDQESATFKGATKDFTGGAFVIINPKGTPTSSFSTRSNPVKKVLDVIDAKSKVQHSKVKFSKTVDQTFNDIIEQKTGIEAFKEYSAAKAQTVGAKKGRFKFMIPPSAEDFVGLLYPLLGKGKVGDAQMAWFKEHLLNPFARAMENVSNDRVQMMNDFRTLKKELVKFGAIPKNLKKKAIGNFTQEDIVRAIAWDQQGIEIEGLSKRDLAEFKKFVEDNPGLQMFIDELININKGDGYAYPGKNWLAGTITTDLIEGLNTTKRTKYLQEWQQNVDLIFSEKNLNKLEAAFGSKYREALEDILGRMKSGKNRKSTGSRLENRMLDYVNNSIGTVMFLNMRSGVLQTISAINFMNWSFNNPLQAGIAFANQKQYWTDFMKLINSDFLVDRRNGLRINVSESEIADAARGQANKPRAVVNYLLKKGFLVTQIMDSFAIASGGATFYRNKTKSLMKSGMSQADAEAKAFQEFREIAEESQQSSRPDRISQQQASGAGRVVLAFANTPMQYNRLIKKATLDLINGRGDYKTNLSRIIYYGMIQNFIFTALQQALFAIGFGDDEEEKEAKEEKYYKIGNSMIDNLLRGLGIGGQIVMTGKNLAKDVYMRYQKTQDEDATWFQKQPHYEESAWKLLEFSPPLSIKLRKLRQAAKNWEYNKWRHEKDPWSLEDPAYLSSAYVISALFNIPLDRLIKKITNVRGAMEADQDWWKRVALLSGWQEWELETTAERSERKKIEKKERKEVEKGKKKSKSKFNKFSTDDKKTFSTSKKTFATDKKKITFKSN